MTNEQVLSLKVKFYEDFTYGVLKEKVERYVAEEIKSLGKAISYSDMGKNINARKYTICGVEQAKNESKCALLSQELKDVWQNWCDAFEKYQSAKVSNKEELSKTVETTRTELSIFLVEKSKDAELEVILTMSNIGAWIAALAKQILEDRQAKVPAKYKDFLELKRKHPEAILLMRNDNSYEAYEEDAKKISQTLGLTLQRGSKKARPQFVAAFAARTLDTNLPKLIRAGERIAICDHSKKDLQK